MPPRGGVLNREEWLFKFLNKWFIYSQEAQLLTKDDILDCAFSVVSQTGLKRFSLTEVAERLGVVKSALYHHFPGGKRDIITALFTREENRILEAMSNAVSSHSTTRERLIGLAKAKIELIVDLGRLYKVREEIAEELEGFLVSRRRYFLKRELDLISSVIKEGISRGELRELNATLLAVALQGALQNLSRDFVFRQSPLQEVESLIDLLFRGIGAKGFEREVR